MSANFPSGTSENGADTSSRGGTAGSKNYDDTRAGGRQSESLRNDLSNLKTDLDALLARGSTLSERELSEAYARMMTKFSSMRFAAKGIAAEAGRQLNQGVDITSDYVKTKPLQSVAMAAGAGLFLGMLMSRR